MYYTKCYEKNGNFVEYLRKNEFISHINDIIKKNGIIKLLKNTKGNDSNFLFSFEVNINNNIRNFLFDEPNNQNVNNIFEKLDTKNIKILMNF